MSFPDRIFVQQCGAPGATDMSQQWYYAVGGNRQGPISAEQLKQLAASGQLQPSDFVWKEGMAEWAPANKVKGLFAEQPKAPPSPPTLPPLPSVPPSSCSGLAPPPEQQYASPPLWNPRAAWAWSILFSWGFGAFLVARNWRSLGEEQRARRSMIWFYSVFVLIPLALLAPDGIPQFVALAALVAWIFIEAQPQIRLLKERFNGQYPRRPWGKPLIAGAAAIALFGLAILKSPEHGAGNAVTSPGNSYSRSGTALKESSSTKGTRPFKTLDECTSDSEQIQAVAEVAAFIAMFGGVEERQNIPGPGDTPEKVRAFSERLVRRCVDTGPNELNQLMRQVALKMGADKKESTRHLLNIVPTEKKPLVPDSGAQGLLIRYGDFGGRAAFLFIYSEKLRRYYLFSADFGNVEYSVEPPFVKTVRK